MGQDAIKKNAVETEEAIAILTATLERMDQLAATNLSPSWEEWDVAEHEEELEHGPAYSSGEWFVDLQEYQSACGYVGLSNAWEAAGLLTTWRRYDRRLSNIKLTAKGLKIARELAAPKRARTRART